MDDELEKIKKKQDEFAGMLDRFGGELYSFRQFLETLLRLLLDVSLFREPKDRLASLFKASTVLPMPIMKLYVHEAVGKASLAKIGYGELFDALIESLGDTVKDLELTAVIKRHYGLDVAQKWEEILRNSNPSISHARGVKIH
jgi:hypothetical protein